MATPHTRPAVAEMDVPVDNPLSLDRERQLVCLEALWEIEAIARALPFIEFDDENSNSSELVLRGLAARLITLSCAAMSGVEEGSVTTSDLNRKLFPWRKA